MMCKEQAKQGQAQRYARRTKEKEEQQEDEAGNLNEQWKEGETGELGDLIVEQTGSNKPGEPKPKNPRGGRKRTETVQEQLEEEEEEYKERTEESTRKRKVIPDTKGIAWRKALEGGEIVDADEYNLIIDCCMEPCLFQGGNLHLKLDETIFGQETDEVKQRIMQKCASLFRNVEKAHQVNLEVARDLKDLANMIREPVIFSKITQAAMQALVVCYTPRIDTFIKQHQVTHRHET